MLTVDISKNFILGGKNHDYHHNPFRGGKED